MSSKLEERYMRVCSCCLWMSKLSTVHGNFQVWIFFLNTNISCQSQHLVPRYPPLFNIYLESIGAYIESVIRTGVLINVWNPKASLLAEKSMVFPWQYWNVHSQVAWALLVYLLQSRTSKHCSYFTSDWLISWLIDCLSEWRETNIVLRVDIASS